MGFLKRLGGRDRAPDWSSFESGADYRAWVDAVERDLRGRGLRFRTGDGFIDVERSSAAEPERMGLGNLAQMAALTDRSTWASLIATHFDNLLAAGADHLGAEFEQVRALLKPRIYAASDIPSDGSVPMSPIAPGLIAILTYDLPTSVRSVSADDIARWPHPIDELFRIAIENLATAPDRPTLETVQIEGGTILALQGDSFFTASEILRLREHVPAEARNGALVSIPNRHALLFHPIVDASAIQAVQAMLQVGAALHRQGPGSISPDLFWWHDGALTVLPSSIDGKAIQFFPPDEFVAVLNELPPAG